ncbi:MAG TPA: hypothetical protein VLL48_04080, partial [Longimicrobiales bacterium]|nr:hypothetical protein [Longimicrobiales bacterium]
WNAGLTVDPRDSTTIYLGSQFLHRSRDKGASWEIISPDLTTNDPEKQRQDVSGGLTLDATGAENHTTILTVAPSPLEDGVIWVGTDDGNVQVTRDGGVHWTNVADRIPGVPEATWVAHVEASRHAPGRAWIVFDDHRRGDWETYLFRTEDYGRSWERVPTEGVFGFAHVVEEDPLEPELLFLGTEFGLWVSLEGGSTWAPWRHGIPAAPVRDLVVHPRDHDLVVATHGRGVWIVDDIRPLRALAEDPGIASRELHLFPPAPAQQYEEAERIGYRSTGMAMYFGEGRPYGALVHYWLGGGSAGAQGATVEILGEGGNVVQTLEGPADPGLNRVVWNLRMRPPAEGSGFLRSLAPEALPGEYGIRVAVGDRSAEGPLTVLPDPRSPYTLADRRAKLAALDRVGSWLRTSNEARERLQRAVRGVNVVLRSVPAGADGLRDSGKVLLDTLRGLEEALFTGPDCQGICGGDGRASRIVSAYFTLASSGAAPTLNDEIAMDHALVALRTVVGRVNEVFAEDVARFRAELDEEGFSLFPEEPPLTVGTP